MFDHKCVFRIKDQEGIDVDELQLDHCDYDDDVTNVYNLLKPAEE